MYKKLFFIAAFALTCSLWACESSSREEEAIEEVKEKTEEAGEKLKEKKEKLQDKLKDMKED